MDSTAASLDIKKILWTNFSLLNLTPTNFKAKYDVEFNRDSFDIPNPSLACRMLYELGLLLNEKLALTYLKIDPKISLNKQAECDFKKSFYQFLQTQSTNQPQLNLQDISTTQLVNLHGKNFYYFLATLTGSILQSVMLDADPSIKLPKFSFEDGHNHKMFVESYAESCQKFCLSKSKQIIKLAENQKNMELSFEAIKRELNDDREKLLKQLAELRVKCEEIRNNEDVNPDHLNMFNEQLHLQVKNGLEHLRDLLQRFILNQPYIENTFHDGCLNSSVLANGVGNYSMQMNDFNKTLNLNASANNTILIGGGGDKAPCVDLTSLLDKMEAVLEPIQTEIELFLNDFTIENVQSNVDKWIEFKKRHSNFLDVLKSLR